MSDPLMDAELAWTLYGDPADDDVTYDDENDKPATDGPFQGKTVTIDGSRGVAWYVDAHDSYNEQITAHMVGDDRPFYFDQDDATEIAREDYCGECGQIGCAHDRLDREDDNA